MAWTSHHRGGAFAGAGLAVIVTGIVACGQPVPEVVQPEVVQGECRPVHGADVCVWGEVSADTVVAFGATVPVGAVENVPAEALMAWPPVLNAAIPLPDVVKTTTGFDNLTIFWEAHGHPPGPYLVPHFDFHFYHIPAADVAAIDCADLTKPDQLAAGYELPDVEIPEIGNLIGLCVPEMGMHALPATEMRASTAFQKTMVVGYYQGRPIFIEPMITRETLLERRSFPLDVPDVPGRTGDGRYPTTFQAEYDSTTQSYKFIFSDLRRARTP